MPAPDRQGQDRHLAPHPVVRPGDWTDKQRGECVERQRPCVLGRGQRPAHAAAGRHDHGRRQSQPQHGARRRVRVEAGPRDDPQDGLVRGIGRGTRPAGLEEDRRPVLRRVPPREQEARPRARGERNRGRQRGPPVPPQQEEQHERRGRELYRGRDAGQRPARPPRRTDEAVGRHERHERDVDLPVVERVPHRLKQQRGRQQPGDRVPPRHPGGPEEDPKHQGHQGDGHQRAQDAGRLHREERQRRQDHGGEGRVAERELRPAGGAREQSVEVPAVQPDPAADPVHVEVDPVRAGADPVRRERQQEKRDSSQVHGDEEDTATDRHDWHLYRAARLAPVSVALMSRLCLAWILGPADADYERDSETSGRRPCGCLSRRTSG